MIFYTNKFKHTINTLFSIFKKSEKKKLTLSVKVFAEATSNQQPSTSNETSTCSTMQK
jgi:hypothetical protein